MPRPLERKTKRFPSVNRHEYIMDLIVETTPANSELVLHAIYTVSLNCENNKIAHDCVIK